MSVLEFQTVIGTNWYDWGTDIRSVYVWDGAAGPIVLAATGPVEGLIIFILYPQGSAVRLLDQTSYSARMVSGVSGDVTMLPDGAATQSAILGAGTRPFGYEVALNEQIGPSRALDTPAYNGPQRSVLTNTTAGFVYTISAAGTLRAYRPLAQAGYRAGPIQRDTEEMYLSDPVALQAVRIGTTDFLLSLSVVEMSGDGTLQIADHVLDTLNARFGQVTILESAQVDGWTYMLAGGGDAGLSLFTLSSRGRLIHLGSVADTQTAWLEQISALVLLQSRDVLRVLAASQSTEGLSYFEMSVTDWGEMRGACLGQVTDTADDDIMTDEAGAQSLRGGGADLFLLEADGARYDPGLQPRPRSAGLDRLSDAL